MSHLWDGVVFFTGAVLILSIIGLATVFVTLGGKWLMDTLWPEDE